MSRHRAHMTEAEHEKYMQDNFPDRVARCATDLEPATRNEPMGPQTRARFDTPVCIAIHSIRKRLADSDGISGKAAIDGLVHCGVLQDDSPRYVKEVRHSQEKGETEKTVVSFFPVDPDDQEIGTADAVRAVIEENLKMKRRIRYLEIDNASLAGKNNDLRRTVNSLRVRT